MGDALSVPFIVSWLLLIQQTDVNVPWSILLSTIDMTSKLQNLDGKFLGYIFCDKKSDNKSRHFDLETSKRRDFLSLIFITKCSKPLFQSEASAKPLI